MGFSEKNDFVEIAEIENFVVGCNWNSKKSQNVPKLFLINKKMGFSIKKLWFL